MLKLPKVSKRLFTDTDQYTPTAQKIDDEFAKLIRPFFLKYAKRGYSMHEMEAICLLTMRYTTVMLKLQGNQYKPRKA